ncbi:MAG: trehalose-6-phosphate synthase [Longimicrobiales bacterium]
MDEPRDRRFQTPGVGPRIHDNGSHPGKARRKHRLMVISNRLPIRIVEGENGSREVRPSSGGLVTALRPVLGRRGGSWTGWPGICDASAEDLRELMTDAEEKFRLRSIPLTARERDEYYLGFSNQTLWPLFHGFPSKAEFDLGNWEAYRAVNWKFATLLDKPQNGDAIWVQDYHLLLLGRALRYQGYRQRIGFFLHTPFPNPEILLQLPCHREIMKGLLHYDSLGFQTERDRRNFHEVLEIVSDFGPLKGSNDPYVMDPLTGAHPISVDFDEWSGKAASGSVTQRVSEIRKSLGNVSTLILGVDRLDYSKGIPAKLGGMRRALSRFPELRGNVQLIQLLVPSREGIPAYQDEKSRIDRMAEWVNREFGNSEWKPVRLIHGEWDREELMAHYRAADLALVTSLRDGMNLVSKEFCACRVREPGSLVLSKFAGSANQFAAGAHLVDPHDPEDVARGIHDAINAPLQETRERMEKMRTSVLEEDVHWWADSFLQAIEEVGPGRAKPSRQLTRGFSMGTGRRLTPA